MREELHYHDLTLRLEPAPAGGYVARVLDAPYRGSDHVFSLPFSEDELTHGLLTLESWIRRRELRPSPAAAGGWSPEQVGEALFETLFSGSVRESLLVGQAAVAANGGGLRIRLTADPSLPGMAPVCALPWELLFRRETRDFLGRDVRTPIVRYLDVPRLVQRLERPACLRILAVAGARGPAELELREELADLEKAGRGTGVEIVPLVPATLGALRETLRNGGFHVLHFMGHGGFDDTLGEGTLLFQGDAGEEHAVRGAVLADHLKIGQPPALVVLNACDSAQLPRHAGQDPYKGVAAALVMAGLPAVVAMQFPISDRAARRFSAAFYGALAVGDAVDVATCEGRLAICRDRADSWEWATPALFTSLSDGRLFTAESSAEAPGVLSGDFHATAEGGFVVGHGSSVSGITIQRK